MIRYHELPRFSSKYSVADWLHRECAEVSCSVFPSLYSKQIQQLTLAELFRLITTDSQLKAQTELHRSGKNQKLETLCFIPSAIVDGGRSDKNICQLTGLLMADFDHLEENQIEDIFRIVPLMDYVVMAYRTLSGRGVRIILSYTVVFPSGTTLDLSSLTFDPSQADEQCSQLIWRALWNQANACVAESIKVNYDAKCGNPARCSVLAYDPDAYFSPQCNALPIFFDEALTAYLNSVGEQKATALRHRYTGKTPGRPALTETDRAFNAAEAAARLHGMAYKPHHRNRFINFVLCEVNRYGIEQEEAQIEASKRYWDYGEGKRGVSSIVRSVYENHLDEHGQGYRAFVEALKSQRVLSAKETAKKTMALVEEFLRSQGEFRHNCITQSLEVKWAEGTTMSQLVMADEQKIRGLAVDNNGEKTDFRDFRNTDLATLMSLYNAQADHQVLREKTFMTVLESRTLAPEYNPFTHYLQPLVGQWHLGDEDYIDDLLQNIVVAGGESEQLYFRDVAKRWLVAMVAGWINMSSTHGTILTFIGQQGTGKSTWFRKLLPPSLQQYMKEQSRYSNMTKDERIALAENGLILLEEIDALNSQDTAQIKALSTMSRIKERAPYQPMAENRPRIATYAATGNRIDFLTDPTGNRRWLPFEVIGFRVSPHDYRVNYTGIYSQALYLAQHGVEVAWKYWFDPQEIALLNQHNQGFLSISQEEELCSSYIRQPAHDVAGRLLEQGEWLTSSQIAAFISNLCSAQLNVQRIGQYMHKCGYEMRKRHNITSYRIVRVFPSAQV